MAKFYTLDEAARTLGIPSERLQAWIVEGRALATRRSGSWVIRDFEVRKLKKTLASSSAAQEQPAPRPGSLPLREESPAARPAFLPLREERPGSRPTSSPPGEEKPAGRPTSLPLREDPATSRPSKLPLHEEDPDAAPASRLLREEDAAARSVSSPLVEGRSIPPPVAPPPPLRTPAPPGLGFNERRQTLGRRREDVLHPASLLAAIEESLREALKPLAEGQRLLLAQSGSGRHDPDGTLAELVNRGFSRLEEILERRPVGELETLRRQIAELEARPPREEDLARALEDMRRTTEEAWQGLRAELERTPAGRSSAAPSALQEELDRLRSERDRLRSERERLVDELASARTDSEAQTRLQEDSREERTRLLRERDELRSALDQASRTGLSLGSERLNLESERDALKVERDALKAERDRATAELASLRSESGRPAADPAGSEGKSELTDLMRRLESLRKPLGATGARPAELAERAARVLEESRGERQQLEARLQEADQEVQELRSRLQGTLDRMQPLAGDLAAARAEAAQSRAEVQDLEKALDEERRRRQEEHQRQDQDLRERERSLVDMEEECAGLRARSEALESELKAAKASRPPGTGAEEAQRLAPGNTARLQGRINSLQRELDAAQRQIVEAREAQARASAEREAATGRIRELQEQLKDLNYKLSVRGTETGGPDPRQMVATIARLEAETAEKDRLIQEGHRQRAELRSELEKAQRAFYELQQRLDREKMEWSEILAREIAQREEAQRTSHASEEDSARRSSGWRLFKPRGGGS